MILYLFVTPLKCFGEEVIFLSEMQSKALNIAFEHVKNYDALGLFSTIVIESNEDIQVFFIANLIQKTLVAEVANKSSILYQRLILKLKV